MLNRYDGSEAENLQFEAGANISLDAVPTDDKTVLTISAEYAEATSSEQGLMSATDKAKLDSLPNFYSGTDSEPTGTFVEGDIYFQLES